MNAFAASGTAMQNYKLVFLGDQSVGKSSIIARFMYDTFDSGYQVCCFVSVTSVCILRGFACTMHLLHVFDPTGHYRN